MDHETSPGWSPDGKKLVYWYDLNLCIIGSDGNDFRQIAYKEYVFGPAWSPDGKTIAFGSGDRGIVLYNIENNEFSELAVTGRRSYPVWSPDGKWILDSKAKEVYLYNLDNRNKFKFSPPIEAGGIFSWQVDKDKLLFFRKSYYTDSYLRIASASGGLSFEPVHLLEDYWHVWQNNSKLLAVWGQNEGDIVIRIVPLSGGKADIIHLDDLPDGKPSPHDINLKLNKLTFSIELENGEKDLYVVPISAEEARTTGPPVKFLGNFRREGTSSLSPDGEKIAYIYEGNIWIAYTNGDDPIRVADFQEEVDVVRWTNDGKSLLFSTSSGWRLMENPGSLNKIMKLLDEGKEIKCSRSNINISPDNSRIAVLTNEQIKIIPIDNKRSSQVLNIGNLKLKRCVELQWSPDGNRLSFIGTKEVDDKISFPEGKSCIFNIPVDGGPPVRVAPDDYDIMSFQSWSPDGKWIAYSAYKTVKVRPESAIWEADVNEIIEKLTK